MFGALCAYPMAASNHRHTLIKIVFFISKDCSSLSFAKIAQAEDRESLLSLLRRSQPSAKIVQAEDRESLLSLLRRSLSSAKITKTNHKRTNWQAHLHNPNLINNSPPETMMFQVASKNISEKLRCNKRPILFELLYL